MTSLGFRSRDWVSFWHLSSRKWGLVLLWASPWSWGGAVTDTACLFESRKNAVSYSCPIVLVCNVTWESGDTVFMMKIRKRDCSCALVTVAGTTSSQGKGQGGDMQSWEWIPRPLAYQACAPWLKSHQVCMFADFSYMKEPKLRGIQRSPDHLGVFPLWQSVRWSCECPYPPKGCRINCLGWFCSVLGGVGGDSY